MEYRTTPTAPTPAPRCPVHSMASARADHPNPNPAPASDAPACAALSVSAEAAPAPDDLLVLPLPRRIVRHEHRAADGSPRLSLYDGDQEIEFDDPSQFGFAQALAGQTRFRAGDAVHWGPGYRWDEVRPLLAALLQAGILVPAEAARPARSDEGARPSPLPPAPSARVRTWDDCEAITAELTGRAVEKGHLETIVPFFRVAHLALDADGRHVGEANVFPPALRTEVPTRWRACRYDGTRHQSPRPMNVSALKAMRAHWPSMMAMLLAVREHYLHRFPQARDGWTVGHVERLSTAVLGLPSLSLMREDRPLDEPLHPALSSLFRVTDGLRMTMHQMLFIPVGEPTASPDDPVSAEQVFAYAERNYSFHSEHGVCAGPATMIREFLAVILDGHRPADLPATLEPALARSVADIPRAFDYAMLGLKLYAEVFSVWPAMTRTYESLAVSARRLADTGSAAGARLAGRLDTLIDRVRHSTYLAEESWRADRDAVYADMHARCSAALDLPRPRATLPAVVAPVALDRNSLGMLQARLRQRFADAHGPQAQRAIADLQADIAAFAGRLVAVLRAAATTQQAINTLLARPAPRRTLQASDLDAHNRMQPDSRRRFPFLLDELGGFLELDLALDATGAHLTDRHGIADAVAA